MNSFAAVVRKDVQDFSTLNAPIKFLLAVEFIILLILSILIGVMFSPKFKQNVVHQGTEQNTSQVTFSIVPEVTFMKPGDESSLLVVLNNGANVSAADIVLSYDPQYIQITEVVNGDFFDREIINTNIPEGMMFSAALNPGSQSTKKEGTVTVFKIKALQKAQETTISFDPNLTIAASNGKNILGATKNGTVHIFD